MDIELIAYTQQNPALDPEELREVSDLDAIWNGVSTFPENVIEYAGRVCYRSTQRMGTAPRFILNRVKEGHEDIIEHVVATVRVRNSPDPLRWRMINRHCEVAEEPDGSWIVSANTRVWLDFFRNGIALPVLPYMQTIAPRVYAEFDKAEFSGAELPPAAAPPPMPELDMSILRPREEGPLRVTLIAFTQPWIADPGIQLHHGAATFFFEGVSRACTHQLVRHRLASFSQESQRYVDLSKGGWSAVVPPDFEGNKDAQDKLDEAWDYLQAAYRELRRMGIRKEDARFLLPNAAETRIVTSMNFSAWSHFLWLRAVDKAAQWGDSPPGSDRA